MIYKHCWNIIVQYRCNTHTFLTSSSFLNFLFYLLFLFNFAGADTNQSSGSLNTYYKFVFASNQFHHDRIELYKKYSTDLPGISANAIQFMELHDTFKLGQDSPDDIKNLQNLANGLINTKDPVLYSEITNFLTENARFDKKIVFNYLEGCTYNTSLIMETSYPAKYKFRAISLDQKSFYPFVEMNSATYEVLTKYACEYLREVNPKGNDVRFVLEDFDIFLDKKYNDPIWMEKLIKCLDQIHHIDPWLKNMLSGKYHEALSWHIRTHNYAKEVKPEQWVGFKKNQNLAYKYYIEACKANPRFPEPVRHLISLSWIDNKIHNPYNWFNLCTKMEIDFYESYSLMNNFLLPRWFGDYEKMSNCYLTSRNTRRYDTLSPFFIRHLRNSIAGDSAEGVDFLKSNHMYEKEIQVLEGYLQSKHITPYLNEEKLIAHKLASAIWYDKYNDIYLYDKMTNRKQLDDLAVSTGIVEDYRLKILYANALKGSNKKLAENLYTNMDFYVPRDPNTINKLQDEIKLTLDTENDFQNKNFYSIFDRHISQEHEYLKGRVVQLEFDKQMTLWNSFNLDYSIINNTKLRGGCSKNDKLYFYTRSYFAPPFEINLKVNIIKTILSGEGATVGIGIGRLFSGKKMEDFCGLIP